MYNVDLFVSSLDFALDRLDIETLTDPTAMYRVIERQYYEISEYFPNLNNKYLFFSN